MFNLSYLENFLTQQVKSKNFLVGYSGGLDSTVLLHMLAVLRQANDIKLRAVHVHHGLQSNADQWSEHCGVTCKALNIPLEIVRVQLDLNTGDSIEAKARQARYKVFTDVLQADEILLTAHHQNDQAETILLQLFRGAGVSGLAAMPVQREFASGKHLRPLLAVPRATLEAYAQEQDYQWCEDDSNADLRFDRNFLRQQIMPLLQQRYPSILNNLSRSAVHCAHAKHLLADLAAQDFELVKCAGPDCIDLMALKDLAKTRQRNVLRYWWQQLNIPAPRCDQLHQIQMDFIDSRDDATPYFIWQGYELRRFKQQLYVMPKLKECDVNWQADWDLTSDLTTPIGTLNPAQIKAQGLNFAKLQSGLQLRFRQGGESINLPKRGRHALKNCWQEWQVPPWQRSRIPLLFDNDELVVIVGYAVAANYL